MSFPVPPAPEVRQVLGLPDVPTYVGKGGFKAVYRMVNTLGQDEALKAIYIPPAQTDDKDEDLLYREQLVARAKRELQALKACNSQHLVKLGSVPESIRRIAGHDYMIYSEEWLSGKPLTAWIGRQRQPDFTELSEVFATLIHLIGELIAIGYLHRDIKPDNIMDTGDSVRRYVMLDLGIAYKIHGTELTQGQNPPGTLLYMAPELLRSDYKDNMDFRCDLYAAGLTCYVLATGIHPFAPQPGNQSRTVHRIITIQPPALCDVRADLPLRFCQIIDRCIRKRPALRYRQLDLVEAALKEVKI